MQGDRGLPTALFHPTRGTSTDTCSRRPCWSREQRLHHLHTKTRLLHPKSHLGDTFATEADRSLADDAARRDVSEHSRCGVVLQVCVTCSFPICSAEHSPADSAL